MENFDEMQKLVEKWELTALLMKCNDSSEKIQLSNILEEMVDNIKHMGDDSESKEKAGILLPLVARIFYEGVHDIKIDKVISIVDKLFPAINEVSGYHCIDKEAELTSMCADVYIKSLKTRNIMENTLHAGKGFVLILPQEEEVSKSSIILTTGGVNPDLVYGKIVDIDSREKYEIGDLVYLHKQSALQLNHMNTKYLISKIENICAYIPIEVS